MRQVRTLVDPLTVWRMDSARLEEPVVIWLTIGPGPTVKVEFDGFIHTDDSLVVVFVTGRRVSGLACKTSGHCRFRKTRLRGQNIVEIDVQNRDGDGRLCLEYSLDLRNSPQFISSTNEILGGNMPQLAGYWRGDDLSPRVPWVQGPTRIVNVRCEDSALRVIGPEYASDSARDPVTGWATFGFYEGYPLGSLVAGSFEAKSVGGGETLLLAPGIEKVASPELLGEIAEAASKARMFYANWLGPAAVNHKGVVVFSAPHGRSRCYGSYVSINVHGLREFSSLLDRRSYILATLCHEFAHSWWSFGVFWDRRLLSRCVNEAIASACELEAVSELAGELAPPVRRRQLETIISTLHLSRRQLVEEQPSQAGPWIAALLFGLTSRLPSKSRAAMDALWDLGHSKVLASRDLEEVMIREAGQSLASAFAAAVSDPQPIVASARLSLPGDGRIALSMRTSVGRRDKLLGRLEAVLGIAHESYTTLQGVVILATTEDDYSGIARFLRFRHVVFQRDARVLGLGAARSRAREWARRVIFGPAAGRPMVRSVMIAAASMMMLVLNSDEPAAFVGLAGLTKPVFSALAHRFALAAAARAVLAEERSLRSTLMGSIGNPHEPNRTLPKQEPEAF